MPFIHIEAKLDYINLILICSGVGLWCFASANIYKIWRLNNRKLPPGYFILCSGITLFCSDCVVSGVELYYQISGGIPPIYFRFTAQITILCLIISMVLVCIYLIKYVNPRRKSARVAADSTEADCLIHCLRDNEKILWQGRSAQPYHSVMKGDRLLLLFTVPAMLPWILMAVHPKSSSMHTLLPLVFIFILEVFLIFACVYSIKSDDVNYNCHYAVTNQRLLKAVQRYGAKVRCVSCELTTLDIENIKINKNRFHGVGTVVCKSSVAAKTFRIETIAGIDTVEAIIHNAYNERLSNSI